MGVWTGSRALAAPRPGYWFLGSPDNERASSSRRRAAALRDQGPEIPAGAETLSNADLALVARVREGSAETFRTLYIQLYRAAWETAYGYVQAEAAAEDVVHDVFLQLWTDRARWQVRGSVRAYILTAIRHKALNVLRHERVVRRDAERDAAEGATGVLGVPPLTPDESAQANDLQGQLEQLIAGFPEMRRNVVTLRWRQGLSVSEIAQVLGVSANAVSIHLTRAREVLLPLLRDPGLV